MVSMLSLSVVDRGFISGAMVSHNLPHSRQAC
jgi:hypothetical protein